VNINQQDNYHITCTPVPTSKIFGVVMQQWCDNQEDFHGDNCIKICVTALCEIAKFAVTSSVGTDQQPKIAMTPLRT
jgi:hypothetical protein